MRVLHVIKGLGPGGAERLLVSLTTARRADVGVDVAYVLPHKDHLVSQLEAAGAGVHLIGGRHGVVDPRWLVRLRHLVRRIEPDVVHVHSPAVAAGTIPLLRAMRHRPAIVTTEHNRWPAFGRLTRASNAIALSLADQRLAVSEAVRASMSARQRDRTTVAVQGIPVAELSARRAERSGARAALGVPDEDFLVVTVANFREKKDYPTLLRAAAASKPCPNIRFVAIGQGPLEPDMRALHRELGLGERFRFLGYHPDPAAVVAGADAFTLASLHEGLPIALLEAMALGVPPVVTSVGGIPEVVTDGVDGSLVEPGDPAALAAKYRELAADPPLRRRIGEAAAARAESFDIAGSQRALEVLYAHLVDSRR